MTKEVNGRFAGIKTLRLERIICDVHIIGEAREDVSISYDGKLPLRVSESQNTLVMEMAPLSFITVHISIGKLIIRVPQTVVNIHVRKMIGKLDLRNTSIDNLQLRSNIGNLLCTNVQARSMLVIAKNIGETYASYTKAETIIAQKNIGNVHVLDSISGTIRVQANIGDIHLVRTSARRLLRKRNIGHVGQKACVILQDNRKQTFST